MSLTEPNPPSEPGRSNGHAGGDIAAEDLAGQLTSGSEPRHGHFTTHFDEPSIDQTATGSAIDATTIAELELIAARYPQARSALLPMLHLVQSVDGRITPRGIEICAEILGLTTAEVSGVATFYTMYKRRPVGEYHVGVCTTALCAIMGGDEVYAKLQDHLGVGNDETTDDGKITLEHLECNAACDFAPVMMVNWEFFDNTTPRRACEIVDALRAGEPVTATRGAQVVTWRESERVLAGFSDNRADEGPTSGAESLLGLKIAAERGWSAPAVPDTPPEQENQDQGEGA